MWTFGFGTLLISKAYFNKENFKEKAVKYLSSKIFSNIVKDF